RTEAAGRITRAVNALGDAQRLTYDAVIGAPHYTMLGIPTFLLDAFLDRVRGGEGVGPLVNCSDCATMVSTFVNLLGADLWQSNIAALTRPFPLNPIMSIGSHSWSTVWGSFAFHEVAWSGECTEDDTVFDACLHTDSDGDPAGPHQASLPVDQLFGRSGGGHF